MYRKLLFCLITSGALAIACGDDDDSPGNNAGEGGEAAEGGDSSEGGSSARGGNAGNAGTGGTTAGRGGGGRTGDGGADDGGADGEGGAGTSCTADDPARCVDDETILVCDPDSGDTYKPISCADDFCPTLGLEEGPCADDDTGSRCNCGDPLDDVCFAGAEELCSCFQGTDAECLTDGDVFAWYLACLEGDEEAEPIVRCFAEGSAQACTLSVEECVPE